MRPCDEALAGCFDRGLRVGGLRFGEYLRAGLPVALLTTLTGALMLYVLRG